MKKEKEFYVPKLYNANGSLKSRWYIYYYEPHPNHVHGIRVRIYGEINKEKSIEKRTELANELMQNIYKPKSEKRTFFDRVFELETINWRKKTVSAYSTVVKYFLEYIANKHPEHITQQQLTEFFLWLYARGTSKNTIEKYRSTLYTLYEKAIYHNLIEINPIKKVKRYKRTPISLMYFNDEQIEILKNEMETNTQLWLSTQLLYYCFIRPGEQRNLKISDINFESGYIEIRSEISKNKKTEKVVIPQNLLLKILYLKEYPNNYYILSKTGHPGFEKLSEKWIYITFKKVLHKLQIRGRYSFYSWKHTGVVRCVNSGMNLRDIQNQLRHHSLEMVQEYLKNLGVMQSNALKYNFPQI